VVVFRKIYLRKQQYSQIPAAIKRMDMNLFGTADSGSIGSSVPMATFGTISR